MLGKQPAETVVYICGPAKMISATQQVARDLGWNESRGRSEMFGAGIAGVAAPFDVQLKCSGRTVHIDADVSILDALLAEGSPLVCDCQRGECGLCPLPVVEADGGIEHRDRYLSDEERPEGQTFCICVSRVRGKARVLDA